MFSPPCGPVQGWADGPVWRATGIRYARAARFAVPVPAADWTEPCPATTWAPACPQPPRPFLEKVLGSGLADRGQDEHCQRLSVTVPAGVSSSDTLPVMVWIHGGSYTAGAGDTPSMDPKALVAEQRVVVVTVTYRLGLFGYLGASAGRPANLGLLDQLEALRWVRRNIAAFGGDPRRITAFGQSAGADAIAHLLAVPAARGLFTRAILQSPPLGIVRGRAAMNAAMAEAAADVTADMDAAEVVSREAGVAARARAFGLLAAMPFGVQYGHDPLPAEDAVEAAWDAAAPGVEVLIGHTAEEGRLFIPVTPRFHPWVDLPVIGRFARRAVSARLTTKVYAEAIRAFADRHVRAGGRAHLYRITWAAPGNDFGSAHTVDLPLLFGDEDTWRHAALTAGASWAELDRAARQVRALWASFARGESLPERGGIPGVLTHRRVRSAGVPGRPAGTPPGGPAATT